MLIEIGGNIWNVVQAMLDNEKPCKDRITINDCLHNYSQQYHAPIPFLYDEFGFACEIDFDYLIAAVSMYSDIKREMVVNYE